MTLTKADLVEHLSNVVGLSKREREEIVERLFGTIKQNLAEGHTVKLSRFGNFKLRDKRERPGRNPKTRETIMIEARRVVTFRAGQILRERVAFYSGDDRPDDEIK